MNRLSDRGSIPLRSTKAEQVELLTTLVVILHIEICFVWCIEENKSNGIVCCESDMQCRYFYAIMWI